VNEDKPAREPIPEWRRLGARIALLSLLALVLVLIIKSWSGRALEIELVHRVEGADALLPADVEIQVWEGDTLHADVFFPRPESLTELSYGLHLPEGEYRLTFSIIGTAGQPERRAERTLTVTDQWQTYHLTYERDDFSR
jgi:hypothetical protein